MADTRTIQHPIRFVVLAAFVLGVVIVLASWLVRLSREKAPAVVAEVLKTSSTLPQDTPALPRAWINGTRTDPSTWGKVKVPAKGDSKHVPAVYGMHVVWGGAGFSVRCVYASGRIGIVSEGTCGDGDLIESYAHNDGNTDLYASYAYGLAGEK